MKVEEEIGEDGELFEHFSVKADEGQQPLRIDKFLNDRIPKISRHKIQLAAKSGLIKVNEQPVKPNYKVKPGDRIHFYLPHPKREIELIPENIPLNIVHEDDYVLVVDKPAGLVVHPGHGNYSGTLVNALVYHFKDVFSDKADLRPGLVHRIDKDTSGLLVIAKDDESLAHLAKQFFERTTKRSYYALVWGDLKEDEGTIEGHIGRHLSDRMLMDVFEDGSQGKPARTHYKVIERFTYVTLVECKLETGRTHQIRVHFKYLGHPLFNDQRYGGDQILKGTTFAKYKQFVQNCFQVLPRQALHAKSLGFKHPKSNKELYFESTLPNDFEEVLMKWRTYISANA